MAVLSGISGPAAIWRWHDTHQRAFDEVKQIVNDWRDHHRVAVDYSSDAPMINLVTDASLTGASGYWVLDGLSPQRRKSGVRSMYWSSGNVDIPVPLSQEILLIRVRDLRKWFTENMEGFVDTTRVSDNKSVRRARIFQP